MCTYVYMGVTAIDCNHCVHTIVDCLLTVIQLDRPWLASKLLSEFSTYVTNACMDISSHFHILLCVTIISHLLTHNFIN